MKHGMYRMPLYKLWNSAKDRCYNPRNPSYANYGGRGITMCDEWRRDFSAFLRDLGERPSPWHTLDRVNNDGPYSKANCRWATRAQQNANSRHNRRLTFQGVTRNLTEWSQVTGVPLVAIRARLNHGWTVERALTTPRRTYNEPGPKLSHCGKTQGLAAWSRDVGISVGTLHSRLKRGWPVERALTQPVR